FSAMATYLNRNRIPAVMPYAIATMMFVQTFFLVVLIFLTNPFERLPVPLPDGHGLNSLLRDPGFLMHPPFLLSGYMSWTIPFAFAMGALISGRLDSQWIKAARPWLLTAWAIQGTGLILGAWWAYHVLGWGGFWGWDPVENVAFLPWLVGTALLHSIIVEESRGMLRKWNMLLIITAFCLAIFGTLVVRGALLASVHNFARGPLAPTFLTFLGVVLAVAIYFFFKRSPLLKSTQRFDGIVSKETGFLLNNLLLLGIAFATLWGTLFPLMTEAFQGNKITVGPPFYEKVNGPIFLALIILMGIGPMLAWRKASWESIKRNFRSPLVFAAIWFVIMVTLLDVRDIFTILGAMACAFTLGVVVLEYYRGVKMRRQTTGQAYPVALSSMVTSNRRRYGGYIVHVGILLIALAVMGVNLHQKQAEVTLKPGETASVGGFTLRYDSLAANQRRSDSLVTSAALTVFKGGKQIDTLDPKRVVYDNQEGQPVSRIAIRTRPQQDLYVLLAAWDDQTQVATFVMFVNPLVIWLWIGGGVFLFGTIIAIWPSRQPAYAPIPARQPVAGGLPTKA
ncbi:MAG: cytochrome c biogenesis protein CcsA, partial [Chloroflexi bacterium]|nr:cytochrome c biogenesis protein CcsA [Chloroflexota bacterium]